MGRTLLLDAAIVGALVLAVLLVVGLIMWRWRKGMGWSLFLGSAIVGALALVMLALWGLTERDLTNDQVIKLLEDSSGLLWGILLFLGVAVAVAALYRFHMIGLAPNLIVEPVKIASSDKFDKNQLLSLTMGVREHLVDNLENIANYIDQRGDKKKKPGQDDWSSVLFSSLSPRRRSVIHHYIDRRLEHLDSLPDSSGPSEQVSWAMSLANFLFPRGSIRISCDLVRTSRGLGVSYEMVDPIDQMMPEFGTLYCNEDKDDSTATSVIDCNRAQYIYEKKLLPNVSKVLAIEICKVQMNQILNHPRYWLKRLEKKARSKAEVYNFIGFLYMNQAKLHDGFFYGQAIKYFQSAIKEDNNWYMPYMYLALTHSIQGQRIERSANAELVALEKALDLQYAARNEYNRALACINNDKAKKGIIIDRAKKRIEIDRARVNLLIGKLLIDLNEEDLQEAQRAVEKALQVIKEAEGGHHTIFKREAKQVMPMAQQANDEAEQDVYETRQIIKARQELTNELTDAQILYHLACCYGIAYGIAKARGDEKNDHQRSAYRLLACSLVRNVHILANHTSIIDLDTIMDIGIRDRTGDTSIIEDPNSYYWRRVDSDPDFESIRNGIQTLKEKLRRKLLEDSSLLEKPKEMSERINEIVKQITKIQ